MGQNAEGGEDPIHDPLIEQFRRETGTPGPEEGGPTAGELKYGGALQQHLASGKAIWENPVINRHNAAQRIFEEHRPLFGGGGGLTEKFVNSVKITDNVVLGRAIPEPPISHRTEGGVTSCWFKNGPTVTGHTVMDIYSMPPWSHIVSRADVAKRFSWNQSCTGGQGDATMKVRGKPTGEKLEEFIRLGEAEHDADSRTVFFSHLAGYVRNVNRHVGDTPETRVRGTDPTDCAGKLRTSTDRDRLFFDYVIEGNKLTNERHLNARHSISVSGIRINNDCTEIIYDVHAGML